MAGVAAELKNNFVALAELDTDDAVMKQSDEWSDWAAENDRERQIK